MTVWRNEPLSAVCDFINRGVSPKYLEDGGIAVLNQKCVRDHVVNYALGRRHDIAAKKVSPERLLREGDVLVNSTGTGTLGRIAQLREEPPEPTTVDSHVTIVRPTPTLFHTEFFGYALIAIEEQIQAGGEGCGGQTELSRSKLAEQYRIRFPVDFQDQSRIVAILDEAFEGIATAKANAEKSLQNVRALFESHLQSVFTEQGEGWVVKPLATLCDLISGQHIDAKDYNTEGRGVGYLTGPSDFGVLNPVITKWTEHPKRMAKAGDILVTVKGSGVGKINLLDVDEVAISRQLMAVRVTATDVSYLYALLSTKFDYFQSLSSGAAIPGISREDVLNLACPMPPPEDQQDIVELIHAAHSQTQRLESLYQQKLTALDELKKSLLHQAFSGQL